MSDNNEKGLMEPIRNADDYRIKKAHTPEANAKRAATMRRKAQKRREDEKFKDLFIEVLSADAKTVAGMSEEEIVKNYSYCLSPDDQFTIRDALAAKMVNKALNETDTVKYIKALEFIRDTSGEKPTDKQEVEVKEIPPFYAAIGKCLKQNEDELIADENDDENEEDKE
jgi:hypothetical protein